MARLNLHVDHAYPLGRAPFKATDPKPANTNSPTQAWAAETREFDLDKVFEEPSRRPF